MDLVLSLKVCSFGRFTSKNHIYEKFDLIGIQRRVVVSFPDRMLLRNHPAFNYKEKSRGYSISSYNFPE